MKLDWRRGAFYVTTLGMEGCWLYALMILLNKQVADARLSVIGLLLLYPLAFGFNKLLQQLSWPKVYLYTLNGLAWVIGMLLVVKIQLYSGLGLSNSIWLLALPRAIAHVLYTFGPELLLLVSSAILWWLGWRLAHCRVTFANSVAEFQFGLVILVIVLFVAVQLKVQLAASIPIVLVFFLFALLGTSLVHAQEGASWLTGLYQGHWPGLLLVSISLVLILGLLISSVVTADFLQLILVALKWVWGLVLQAIAFLVSLFPEPDLVELPPPTPAPEMGPSAWFKMWTLPEPVRSGLRLGWNILVLGLIIVALWRISSQIFGWLRRKLSTTAEAEVESLPGAFKADLLNLLKRIVLKLLGLRLPFRLRMKLVSFSPESASVRQIYHQLLHWAATSGWPRAAFQTPYEYLCTLKELLPMSENELHFITQSYVSARYGLSSPTEEELHQLRQSWHQLRQNRLKNIDNEHTHD